MIGMYSLAFLFYLKKLFFDRCARNWDGFAWIGCFRFAELKVYIIFIGYCLDEPSMTLGIRRVCMHVKFCARNILYPGR